MNRFQVSLVKLHRKVLTRLFVRPQGLSQRDQAYQRKLWSSYRNYHNCDTTDVVAYPNFVQAYNHMQAGRTLPSDMTRTGILSAEDSIMGRQSRAVAVEAQSRINRVLRNVRELDPDVVAGQQTTMFSWSQTDWQTLPSGVGLLDLNVQGLPQVSFVSAVTTADGCITGLAYLHVLECRLGISL